MMCRACLVRAKPGRHGGRRYLKGQPSSRTEGKPAVRLIGEVVETSASFEARYAPPPYPTEKQHFAQFWSNVSPFRMNTCKSVSKQRSLTPFRMTYEKQGEGLTVIV